MKHREKKTDNKNNSLSDPKQPNTQTYSHRQTHN